MGLDNQQLLVLDFVKLQHGEQKRKYTHEPYWHHVKSVAEIVSEYEPSGIEIALCHDLFEDTQCTFTQLHNSLLSFGYVREDAYDFVSIDTFADYYNLDKSKAEKAIRIGRTINEQRHKLKHTPKQNPKPFAISV